MKTFSIIKLTNLSPIHIGMGREATDCSAHTLHSDTLSAALAAIRVQIKGPKEIKEFINSFSISSAFPFWENHLFLPKPQGRLQVRIKEKEESLTRKVLKGVQYIESSLWSQLIKGEVIYVNQNQIHKNLLSGSMNNGSFPIISRSQVNERVSVSREKGKDAEPFFFEWDFYHNKAGLYVLTDAKKELLKELYELFTILGEQGIGTDRNIGGGKFNVEYGGTLELGETKENSNGQLLLSLYIPTEEELPKLNLKNSLYSILPRGGFMAGSCNEKIRHLHKKNIYMFNVGSYFNTKEQLQGKVVDLQPKWNSNEIHPVYRSGLPLSVPIKILNYE
ncbi:type III-A CRISPR-associated RAMP protein Csm4 [Prevotella jejuni]|uniref:type III-A CRISPR-associated RAMP protein Csm4 n=2 Tax=Prevotella TaxID=838 RepID=UPI00352C0F38